MLTNCQVAPRRRRNHKTALTDIGEADLAALKLSYRFFNRNAELIRLRIKELEARSSEAEAA